MVTTLALLAALVAAPPTAARHDPEWSLLPSEPFVLSADLGRVASARSVGALLEQIVHPAVRVTEESGGSGDADPLRVAALGESWRWTGWSLDGLSILDPAQDGTPGLLPPFGLIESLSLVPSGVPGAAGGGLRLGLVDPSVRRGAWARVEGLAGGLGGRWPLAGPIMNAISGLHSFDRRPPPPELRRGERAGWRLELGDDLTLAGGATRWAVELRGGQRRWLDPGTRTGALRGVVPEAHLTARLGAVRAVGSGGRSYAMLEHGRRDRAHAELFHAPAETARAAHTALAVGYLGGRLTAGVLLRHDRVRAQQPGFARDLFDPDGEATSPWFREEDALGLTAAVRWEAEDWHLDAGLRTRHARPSAPGWTHALTREGAPYGEWTLAAAPSRQALGRIELGGRHALALGPVGVELELGILARAQAAGGGPTLGFVDPRLAAVARLPVGAAEWSLSLSRIPAPLLAEVARSLDADELEATLRLDAEDGAVVRTLGGRFVRPAPGLVGPATHALGLGVSHRLSRRWLLRAGGDAKLVTGRWALRFDGAPEAFGVQEGGAFFDRPGETRFVLDTVLDDVAAYWGGHLQLLGRGPSWMLAASFTTYAAIATTPFGSGPIVNDLGRVDASTADPTHRIRGLANVDGDRAFLTRLVAGAALAEGWWLALSFYHRDGQPFAFLEPVERAGQLAFRYHGNRGSPLKFTRPLAGPREDFMIAVDLGLSWTGRLLGAEARLGLLVANLLDFGNELQEIAWTPPRADRAALESETPRSLWLSLELRP